MLQLTREEKKQLREFEKTFGTRFRDKKLLKRALTHKSYANEQRLSVIEDNERLEFLGDAVLELVVSDLLMTQFPDSPEGELSKIRASLVNEKTLAQVAKQHDIGEYLFLGKGEEKGEGRNKPSLLSDALEAILGALYLDRGFKKAFSLIKRIALELFDQLENEDFYRDYKTLLQEQSQNLYKAIPRYQLVKETGPDHDKTFEVNILIKGKVYGSGKGKNKKGAEQKAARKALLYINEHLLDAAESTKKLPENGKNSSSSKKTPSS